jgi:hypothetical protein
MIVSWKEEAIISDNLHTYRHRMWCSRLTMLHPLRRGRSGLARSRWGRPDCSLVDDQSECCVGDGKFVCLSLNYDVDSRYPTALQDRIMVSGKRRECTYHSHRSLGVSKSGELQKQTKPTRSTKDANPIGNDIPQQSLQQPIPDKRSSIH